MALFEKPAIGLDISDHSIEAVLIVRRGGRYVLASYGRTILPPGLVVCGVVERRDELSVVLRKLLADQMTPPLPSGLNEVAFALPESQVFSHIFEVPRIADDEELGQSLAIEADGFFPYNHAEMVAGRAVTALRPDKKDVYYAAVTKETLQGFLNLFRVSGLQPIVIESESTSIARAVLMPDEPDPVLFVDLGARVTNLSIFDRNGIQFSESLETAGDAFDAALARSLAISREDAESLRRNQGISGDLDLRAQKALGAQLERLAADIKDALTYYEGRSKRVVKRVVLCGGTSLTPGLLEWLSEKLPVGGRILRVQIADPWLMLDVDPTLDKLGVRARGVLITTAIGLALRGIGVHKFSEINFLDALPSREMRKAKKLVFTAPFPTKPAARSALALAPSGAGLAALKAPVWIKAGLTAVAVLILAFAVWAAAFILVPRLLKKAPPPPSRPSAASVLTVETTVTLGPAFSDEKALMTAVPIDVETEVTKTFPHAATKTNGTAFGQIRLINKTVRSQALIATTRLLSEKGVLFRLKDRAFVPAGGEVAASVAADQPGPDGDAPPGRFTLPGLPASLQSQIYGQSDAAMTGGAAYAGAPLTQDEIDKNLQTLAGQQSDALFNLAKSKAGAEYIVLTGLFAVTGETVVSGPQVGAPTPDYALKATIKGRSLAFSPDEEQKILRRSLAAQLSAGENPSAYVITPVSYQVQTLKATEGSATVTIRAEARAKKL